MLRRRARAVASAAVKGTMPTPALMRSLAEDGFALDSIRLAFARPEQAHASLVRLLEHAALRVRSLDEAALRDRLTALGGSLEAAMTAAPSVGAGLEQVAGWTLTHAEQYQVRIVPSEAIRPVLLSRTVELQEALVVVSGPAAPTRDLVELAEALKALGNPQRLAILRDVAHLPATGQDLAEILGLTEATVHHHTSTLRAAGLLTSEREGQRVYHVTDKVRIAGLFDEVLRGVFGA
jgi:DNA-binding transcriptional ArsR family regulator